MSDRERFASMLNLERFAYENEPLRVGEVTARPARDHQRVLRMLVEAPYSRGLQLPEEMSWTADIIAQAKRFQRERIGIAHPFVYVTIRHGVTKSVSDAEWHVDGFSVKYNHLPEANYIFASGPHTTQFARQAFCFPPDFDPMKHNIHRFFQRRIKEEAVSRLEPDTLYFIDPYVVHRRDPSSSGMVRTFCRVSFTPIEIPDVNNTPNPLIETRHYCIDGVREFRDHLQEYDAE